MVVDRPKEAQDIKELLGKKQRCSAWYDRIGGIGIGLCLMNGDCLTSSLNLLHVSAGTLETQDGRTFQCTKKTVVQVHVPFHSLRFVLSQPNVDFFEQNQQFLGTWLSWVPELDTEE